MRKHHSFALFGNDYRVLEFAATDGVDILCQEEGKVAHPLDVLKCSEVWDGEAWKSLTSRDVINAFVNDALKMSSPTQVLEALMARVYQFNFAFLGEWKPVHIPKRLLSELPKDVEQPRIDPVISLIVMSDKATMRELEEYYSTADAFKMYDMIAVDNLNKALGTEAAINESKSKQKRHH